MGDLLISDEAVQPVPPDLSGDRPGPALQWEIEQFLYHEAQLLDRRRFDEWLALLADDLVYRMPVRSNRHTRDAAGEIDGPERLAHFDEDKTSMGWRVRRLASGMAWAEEPPSRTRHLVSNVVIDSRTSDDELNVSSCFIVYRSRGDAEVDLFAGERDDVLRRSAASHGWSIVRRVVLLDQSTLRAKNLSIFF